MKTCKTCNYHKNDKCIKHSTHTYSFESLKFVQPYSEIEFIGDEEIETKDDFGCSQHYSNRKLSSLTNDEFLFVIGSEEEENIIESFKYYSENKNYCSLNEHITSEKNKFRTSIQYGYSEEDKMYFRNAIIILRRLETLGISTIQE